MNADEVIAQLGLLPHPEGGHYRETFRDESSTAIYYALKAGEFSHWHRVDAVEIWHWHAGHPLSLSTSADGKVIETHVLGPHVEAGQRPQVIIPRNAWQSARPVAGWVLCGCTVAPPFAFDRFEMAPPGWSPG